MNHKAIMSVAGAMVIMFLAISGNESFAAGEAGEESVAAYYSFENVDTLGEDGSGNGHSGTVSAAESASGKQGNALLLDGSGGLTVPSSEELNAQGGFSLECWIKFSSVTQNMNLLSKEDEYLLRVDPLPEGGNISFFVDLNGQLEPRVRGPIAKADTWYHIIATWDGEYATLWVNGRDVQAKRVGAVPASDSPVIIGGPSQWGPVGLNGLLDEVKLHNRALTQGEVLGREYGLDAPFDGARSGQSAFEFANSEDGWEGLSAGPLSAQNGQLCARTGGHGSVLLKRGLEVDLADNRYVAVRMSVSAGASAKLVFRTSAATGASSFNVIADGSMHSYVLPVDLMPEWEGTLNALGIAPSDVDADVRLDFVRVAPEPLAPPEIAVKSLLPDRSINRAQRLVKIIATVHNSGGDGRNLVARLSSGPGVQVIGDAAQTIAQIGYDVTQELSWQVRADAALAADLRLTVEGGEMSPAVADLTVPFAAPIQTAEADYVPEPQIPKSDVLVGAHYCPLWKQGSRQGGWDAIVPFPERKPALGWYDEDDPEVTDWEVKWSLEHGINFFVYCWYRASQGGPVETFLGHAIHDGLFNSRYGSEFKWCIMWENQQKGRAGVSSEQDLLENLLPYWIENYFKKPTYLKMDNKPLLFVYRPEYLVEDLGSVEAVKQALEKMRQACRDAGFDGLTILGEYRGADPRPLQLMVDEGLDYSFAYCWPVGGAPEPDEAIRVQEDFWQKRQELGVIPDILTLSMGWDSTPWHPSSSTWRLPPDDFKTLCDKGREFMGTLPDGELGSKLILLDNWNEFGEGHYIAPHREYGFGYLDAVRDAFTEGPKDHVDLVPEDIGLGPYEKGYTQYVEQMQKCAKKVTADGGDAAGLFAWWSFDEEDDVPCAWDYTGNRRGGFLSDAKRADGLVGRALVCDGGSVIVPPAAGPYPDRAITIECWLKTDQADQSDRWFMNNIFGGGLSGFRFGLAQGKLCWAIPRQAWSHHLSASEPLPLGRWVHVAATYDGQMMRIYMDGKQVAETKRGGRIHTNDYPLAVGNFAQGHRAHFAGLLDEVRIHSRALSPEEITARAAR